MHDDKEIEALLNECMDNTPNSDDWLSDLLVKQIRAIATYITENYIRKDEVIQLVIEDVPHEYQGRLLERLR